MELVTDLLTSSWPLLYMFGAVVLVLTLDAFADRCSFKRVVARRRRDLDEVHEEIDSILRVKSQESLSGL